MNNLEINNYSKKKLMLSTFVFLLLLACTSYLFLKNESIPNLIKTIKGMNPYYITLGLAAVFVFISSEAINTTNILKSLGNKISFLQALKYSFIGFYFCSITPSASGGQPMQVYYMKKDGIKISSSSLALLANLVVYKMVILGFCILVVLFNSALVAPHIRKIWALFTYGVIVNIITTTILILSIFYKDLVIKLGSKLTRLLFKLHIIKSIEKWEDKIEQQVDDFADSAKYIMKKPKLIAKLVVVTIIQITALYSVPYFVYKAFSLSTYSMISIISLQAILNTSVSTIPLPGAVGVTEGSFLLLFKAFFPKQKLTSAMLVSRGISFYAYLLVSSFVTLIAHLLSNCKSN